MPPYTILLTHRERYEFFLAMEITVSIQEASRVKLVRIRPKFGIIVDAVEVGHHRCARWDGVPP